MFHISDGRNEFYQWDLDRKVVVEDETVNQVHFCNKTDDCSLVCEVCEEEGVRYANVPNVLLQDTWDLNVYGYDVNYTKHSDRFAVLPRTKPSDYVYTETEVYTYHQLEARLDEIEENGISDEQLDKVVTGYFEEHPIPEPDLTGYATTDYVDEAVSNVDIPDVDLTGYALKTDIPTVPTKVSAFTNDAGYLTQHQSLDGYAKIEDIPDLDGYYTKEEIDALIPASAEEVSY